MTDFAELLREPIARLPVYQPGKPIELVAREYGLDPARVSKLASNENPLGASPMALEAAQAALKGTWLYPDNASHFLREKLAAARGVEAAQIVVGAGSNELFYWMGDLFMQPGVEVVMGRHAFITYKIVTLLYGATPVEVEMPDLTHDLDAMRAAVTERTRLIFLPSPNNPTGTANKPEDVVAFARSLPDHVVFVFDDAYGEYADEPVDLRPLIAEGRKILWTRTFSKIYGLAGLRIGYGVMPQPLAELLNRVRSPFNVGNVAQAAAMAALDDGAFVERSREVNAAGLRQLSEGLAALGLKVAPSQGNFLLVEAPEAQRVFLELQQQGVIVRPMEVYGLPQYLRVSVGLEADNARFLAALGPILETVQADATARIRD